MAAELKKKMQRKRSIRSARSVGDAAPSVSLYDAKAGFSELVERVSHGQEVVITRHGQPIVRMVPFGDDRLADQQSAAIARLLIRRRKNKLQGISIMDLVRESREGRK